MPPRMRHRRRRREREFLASRQRELAALAVTETEWSELNGAHSRLANASQLIEAATQGEELLNEGDDAISVQLAQFAQRLSDVATHDPALAEIVALLEPARIQLDEAARALARLSQASGSRSRRACAGRGAARRDP